VELPEGEETMTLAFFVLTQYQLVTDGQTDTLLSQRPGLAKRRAGKNTTQNAPLTTNHFKIKF